MSFRLVTAMCQTEQEYADQVRQRQQMQLARRAREIGYELRKIEPDRDA